MSNTVKWARLWPKDVRSSIFEIRGATSCRLVVGERWGDDYLELPQGDEDLRVLVLTLVEEAGWGVELLEKLPPRLHGLED